MDNKAFTNDENHIKTTEFMQNGIYSNGGIHTSKIQFEIRRDTYDYDVLHSKYSKNVATLLPFFLRVQLKLFEYLKAFKASDILYWFLSLFPILKWMRVYDWRGAFLNDLIAGFTVSILTIPQGMANGLLSGVTPIEGLYTTFFPVIVYAFMGTSHHMSMGSFSILSIMVREASFAVVNKEAEEAADYVTYIGTNSTVEPPLGYTNLEVLTSLALLCGIVQLAMGFCHVGVLSILLSDTLVSALQCAAAIHVITSQVPSVFNIKIERTETRLFRLIHDWINIVKNLKNTNLTTFIISCFALFSLYVTKEVIQPKIRSKYPKWKIPIPIDIIVVITVTLIAWLMNLEMNKQVEVVGDIPQGLPSPQAPRTDIFKHIIMDAIVITIVMYSIQQSLAQTFAKIHNYKVDPNQELVAMGAGNVLGSFFSCFTVAPALSRCSMLDVAGSKTQVAKIVSCIIVLVVLYFVGPLLYHLPKCILGCIIIVALKRMIWKWQDLPRAIKISNYEALTWVITFLAVICFDVDLGLLIGIVFALFTLLLRLSLPHSVILGRLPDSEIYANVKGFRDVSEMKGIKIFHFNCALFFINRQLFHNKLYKKVFNLPRSDSPLKPSLRDDVHTVIIDCSSIFYIDMSGVETIIDVINEMKRIHITTVLASCNENLISMFERTQFLPENSKIVFATVHDAVLCSVSNNSEV